MVEAIGIALASSALGAEAAGATIIGTLTVGQAVGGALGLGLGLGINFAASSLLQDDKQKIASQQFSTRQPLPSRRRTYGRDILAGPYTAYDVANGQFIQSIYVGEGPYDEFEGYFLDNTLTAIPPGQHAGAAGVAPWLNYIQIDSRLGIAGEPASALLTQMPYFDATSKLSGCAYVAWVMIPPKKADFNKRFKNGGNPVGMRVLVRGARVRDPAQATQTGDAATWKWSDNASLCIRDILTHELGLRVPLDLINEASFAAFAALCQEPIVAKDGTQYPRYWLGGTYNLTDDPVDTLNAMLATCDGELYLEIDGTIGIRGGRFPAPSVTITDADIISLPIERGATKLAAFNRLKVSYVSPLHDYQLTEGQSWDDLTAQSVSGEVLEEDFSLPWVRLFNQARRLAKIRMAKGNPEYRITGLVTRMSAAAALFEPSVRFTAYGLDFTALVTRAVANVEKGTCTFDLISLSTDAYAFDANTEEGTAPAIPGVNASPSAPAPPVNLVATIERRAVSGDQSATFLRLKCQQTSREDLSLSGRYRLQGSGATGNLTMAQDGDDPFSLISGVLTDGAAYEVYGAIQTYYGGNSSDYIAADPAVIIAVADAVPPAAPLNVTVSGVTGQVHLDWDTPGSPNFAATRIYRSTGSEFSTSTRIATFSSAANQHLVDVDGPLSAGQFFYWLTSVNGSGVESAPVGPFAATVV